MRSLIFVFALLAGCGLQQDQTTEKLDQAKNEPKPIPAIIHGTYATVYRLCDGKNLVYYAERYNAVALETIKDGCTDGR